MQSFELTLNIQIDELVDRLEEEVFGKRVFVGVYGIDQEYVELEAEPSEAVDQPNKPKSFNLIGGLWTYRNGSWLSQGLGIANGQARLDLVPLDDGTRVVATVDGDPQLQERIRLLMVVLEERYPLTGAAASEANSGADGSEDTNAVEAKPRRGGPVPTPEADKLRIVQGWQKAQEKQTQEAYAQLNGISPSTLRKWKRELEAEGKL